MTKDAAMAGIGIVATFYDNSRGGQVLQIVRESIRNWERQQPAAPYN